MENINLKPLYRFDEIEAMHLELTDKCNASCPMCPRYIDGGGKLNPYLQLTEMSLQQFKKWFSPEFIKKLKHVYACGNYGDPTVAKDCLEIFQYLRECNAQLGLGIFTNGSARSSEWWGELGKIINNVARGDLCTFSVDGLGDTNSLYRRNTDFDKILTNMKSFKAAGGVACWDFIVFRHNEHQIDLAQKLARELKFEIFNVTRTARWHSWTGDGQGYFTVLDKNSNPLYNLEQPYNKHFQDQVLQSLTCAGVEQLEGEGPRESLIHKTWNIDKNESFLISHNELEVRCLAQARNSQFNSIFIGAGGHVFPCCFLGGEPWRYAGTTANHQSDDSVLKMIDLEGGLDTINLNLKNIEKIIDGNLFRQLLPESLNVGSEMRSRQCSTCCGKNWNKLKDGEFNKDHKKSKEFYIKLFQQEKIKDI